MMKVLKLLAIVILGLVVLAFLFISPIVKYVVQENSEAWTGRKIRIEGLWINIFGGSVHVSGFRMMEAKSDSDFIRIGDVYANISVNQLLGGKYVLEKFHMERPEIVIAQHGNRFNYDDLVMRFADTTKPKEPTKPTAWYVEDFWIDSATVRYSNFKPATHIVLTAMNISSPPMAYTDSIYRMRCGFGLESGGRINTCFTMRSRSGTYGLSLKTDQLNLAFLLPYLKDYLKVQSLDGSVSTRLVVGGRIAKSTDVFSKGTMSLENFSIIDTTGEKLAACRRFYVDVDTLSTPASLYNLHALILEDPYIRFGMFVDGYNFDRIMTKYAIDTATAPVEEYSNIFQMMAGYIRDLSREYLLKEYRVDTLRLTGGNVMFTDYTLEDKFQYVLDSLSVRSDNFNSRNDRILIALGSRLNKSGILDGTLNVNPNGYSDMDIDYKVSGLLISDINPYSKYYVATPFLDGVITYTNTSNILDSKLKSNNHLLIEHIRVGDKVHNKAVYKLPVKLAVAILRDTKGNIDLDIPVEGDLKDPKYKLGKVIWQVLTNLLVKAATAPYKLLANAFGGNEADYKEVQFQYLQKGLSADQDRILDQLAKVPAQKPEVGISFLQVNNMEDEVEYQALFRAKKEYLGYTADTLAEEEYQKVEELSAKDSLFNLWLEKKLGGHAGLTSVESKCVRYCGKEKLQADVEQIMGLRNEALRQHMQVRGVKDDRLKISNARPEDVPQHKGMPRYVVNYFTDSLQVAAPDSIQAGK